MSIERDEIDLKKMSKKQQDKLINFYGVDSIDDLEVLDDGEIVVKKKGRGKSVELKVYLQDYDGKEYPLDIDEYIEKQKNPPLGFIGIEKSKAKQVLEDFIYDVLKGKKTNELRQLCIEHIDKSSEPLLLFQQFIIFHADKLKSVLCGDEINKKYIKATGNPGYSDVDFYNIIKKSNNELIIKGFAFCGFPNKNELYINTVCGTGGTGTLIGAILGAVENKILAEKAKYISLDSIETKQALQFYTKLGFRKPKQDAKRTIQNMISSKSKSFDDYAEKNASKAGGKLYLFPHNAEGEKYLKKLHCEWIYEPVRWFERIQELKKQKKTKAFITNDIMENTRTEKLEGNGIGDFFKSIVNKGKEFINRFKPKLDDFTNQSKRTLSQYGDWRVINMYVQRKPIMGILDKFFNVLTFGKFQELKQKYGYDKLFHLQLGMVLWKDGQIKKVVAEKNETVDITEAPSTGTPDVETLRVVVPPNKQFTLNDIVNQTRQRVGDNKFFSYDPFNNNCQFFISYLLETMGMYGPREKAFLFQDMAEFQKELPKWLPKFARGVTDVGATFSNIIGKGKEDGLELQAVIIKKDEYNLESALAKAKEILGKKKFFRETQQSYRFRNIPKQRFQRKSFVTKRLDNGVSLVLGKLK